MPTPDPRWPRKLTTEVLSDLKTYCAKASPGPWTHWVLGDGKNYELSAMTTQGTYLVALDTILQTAVVGDAYDNIEFISRMDPTTVLSLITEIETLRSMVENLSEKGIST